MNRLLLRWTGGKSVFVKAHGYKLVRYLQRHDGTFIEPFLGGGAMAFHVAQAKTSGGMILSDLLEPLIVFYRVLKNNPAELSYAVAERRAAGAAHPRRAHLKPGVADDWGGWRQEALAMFSIRRFGWPRRSVSPEPRMQTKAHVRLVVAYSANNGVIPYSYDLRKRVLTTAGGVLAARSPRFGALDGLRAVGMISTCRTYCGY